MDLGNARFIEDQGGPSEDRGEGRGELAPGKAIDQIIEQLFASQDVLIDARVVGQCLRERLALFGNDAVEEVLMRVATDIQPVIIAELRTWLMSMDAWLCCASPLVSPVEHRPQICTEIANIIDTICAAWTREVVFYFSPHLPEVANACQGSTLNTIRTLYESYEARVINAVCELLNYDVLNIRQLGRLAGSFANAQTERVNERILETLGMPERFERLRYVMESPPSELVDCAKNTFDEWRQPLLTCFVGEPSAERLRHARVPNRPSVATKEALLDRWVRSYGTLVTKICRDAQTAILGSKASDATERAAELVSAPLSALRQQIATFASPSTSAFVPTLWGKPTPPFKPTSAPQQSPRRVSIRTTRLLATVYELLNCGRLQLPMVSKYLLKATLKRIALDDKVAQGLCLDNTPDRVQHQLTIESGTGDGGQLESSSAASLSTSTTASVSSIDSSKRIDVIDVVRFLTNRSGAAQIMVSDVASEIGLTDDASALQRISPLLRKLVDACKEANADLSETDVQYISSTEHRRIKGAGRVGRNLKSHICCSGIGMSRLSQFASDLIQMHTNQAESFYANWGLSKRSHKRKRTS